MNQSIGTEVFTLEEAAAYLKLPLETVAHEADQGHLPGRRIADTWRFLKSAIDDWLRARNTHAALAAQAGALKDDPYLDELVASIYREREQTPASQ